MVYSDNINRIIPVDPGWFYRATHKKREALRPPRKMTARIENFRRLWESGYNTLEISEICDVEEPFIYNRIDLIKRNLEG